MISSYPSYSLFLRGFKVDLAFLFDFGILFQFSDFEGIRFAMSRYQTHETRMTHGVYERHRRSQLLLGRGSGHDGFGFWEVGVMEAL
jgi:hypothetical protein